MRLDRSHTVRTDYRMLQNWKTHIAEPYFTYICMYICVFIFLSFYLGTSLWILYISKLKHHLDQTARLNFLLFPRYYRLGIWKVSSNGPHLKLVIF